MARKVLLADDSVTAQNMGRKILADAGYEVVTVNNGSAALKKVAEAHPDLIVLDVYMPGYSGLEVCQRIKESRETAQIPVLLTVGKLEPFKQDEARRVRADAFIIKPFEASELTAALAKLESRMGQVPASRKESRQSGPTTMESFERTASTNGPQYGDEESGWKSRIKFPSGTKAPQAEPEPEIETFKTSNGSFRELITEKPMASSFAAPSVERPMPAGIPPDITPDEIAALAAAAARVKSGITVGKNFERLTDEVSSSTAADQKTSAGTAESAKLEKAEALPASATTEPPRIREVAEASVPPILASVTEASSQVEPPAKVDEKISATPAPGEVQSALSAIETATAAQASASTAHQVSQPSAPLPPAVRDVEEADPVTVAAVGPTQETASASTRQPTSIRRWIAEEIPVDSAEAALVLEREMHKAYAALAAADHGPSYTSAPIDHNDEPMFATMAPPAIGAPLPMMETPRSIEPVSASVAASSAPEHSAHLMEISKPPAAPFAPAGSSREEPHAVVAFGGPELMGSTDDEKRDPAMSDRPMKRAAVEAEVQSATPAIGPESLKAEVVSSSSREAELAASAAAAWANWRDVRDSVLSPKGAPETVPPKAINMQGASEESKKAKELKQDRPASGAPAEAAMAAAASADAAASSDPDLSNIVDHMLAELKPKLMAELAEKLKKEQTKK